MTRYDFSRKTRFHEFINNSLMLCKHLASHECNLNKGSHITADEAIANVAFSLGPIHLTVKRTPGINEPIKTD